MAEHMEVSEAAAPTPPPVGAVAKANAVVAETEVPAAAPARARERIGRSAAGERWIARILRGGAIISGTMFLGSLALEALPQSETVQVAIDTLRKGAASLLLVTPVARLVMAGTMLGLRGEWRYTLCAAGVLGLLALAVGAGISA
ncbi:hypothetical protein [Hyalangium minutum]|uniref:DUF1634 domain-containing protein n=1 Tax=Hyalangium minutum TaxID=394096 RepID=A0A085WHK5_9BACT|nr:hypothetical protein [Hyalangium minutum]KFE67168.1 hypothetical protein DB31_8521 [Hyalangium minutum]